MKRTFERIGFMLVGALLVCAAYLVGKAEHSADADFRTFRDVHITDRLIVQGEIIVGRTNLDGQNNTTSINHVRITGNEDGASVLLVSHPTIAFPENFAATVAIIASSGTRFPHATVDLQDNRGNGARGSALFGWKHE